MAKYKFISLSLFIVVENLFTARPSRVVQVPPLASSTSLTRNNALVRKHGNNGYNHSYYNRTKSHPSTRYLRKLAISTTPPTFPPPPTTHHQLRTPLLPQQLPPRPQPHHQPPSDPDPWHPTPHLYLLLTGQTCVVFIVALDSTILTLSLPTIATSLHATATSSFWILSAYLLASAVVQPLMAAFADVFGRRSTFFTSVCIFTLGTVVCCTADTVVQMLVGRVVQGVGGGGIFSVNLIILSDVIPLRERSKYVGIVQGVNSLAVNFGPLIGAAMIGVSWRWVFYVNFPFCAVGLAAIPGLLRYVKAERTVYERLGQIDWAGSGVFVAGATAFLVGVSWGGNQFAWGSAATLVPIVGGVVVVGAALVYERRWAGTPFLRLELFGTRSAVAVYGCTVLQSLTLFTATYFLNLYFLTVKLFSPITAGTIFLAYSFAVVPVSGITGQLITKFGSYKWAIFTGWLINTFGLGAFMILDQNSYIPGVIFMALVAGAGQGLLFMAHQVAAQAGARAKDVGYASAMFSFARSLGFCLGIAIGGTIFQNFLRQRLSELGLPGVIAEDSEAFASILRGMVGSKEKDAIVGAYAWAFRYLWAVMAGVSGLGFGLSWLIEEYTLDVELDSTHRLRSGRGYERGVVREEKEGGTEVVVSPVRRASLAV